MLYKSSNYGFQETQKMLLSLRFGQIVRCKVCEGKMVCDDRTLREVANEFLALKKAQKVQEGTLNDYKKYINKFLEQSENSLDVDALKMEILEYFADIPKTSPIGLLQDSSRRVKV